MLASTNYGADSSGLICGYRFGVGGQGEPIASGEAIAWLTSTGVADGFVWLHFNLAHAATQKWLREHAALSDVFHESLGAGSRSTRVELDDRGFGPSRYIKPATTSIETSA